MHIVNLILLVFSFVFFIISAILFVSPPNLPHRLLALGLALEALTIILDGFK